MPKRPDTAARSRNSSHAYVVLRLLAFGGQPGKRRRAELWQSYELGNASTDKHEQQLATTHNQARHMDRNPH
eukprot:7724233-Alexandrium_andersonii.AAC.1